MIEDYIIGVKFMHVGLQYYLSKLAPVYTALYQIVFYACGGDETNLSYPQTELPRSPSDAQKMTY